jgi:segregation and condensation protein A
MTELDSFAKVRGQAITELPKDLYIPPEALEIFLEAFAGPLDLLLYLIKKQDIDILDIPIAEITRQYMEYVEMMKDLHLELAAEYMVMAVMLAEIKSRMLLPKSSELENEEDPRAELVRRLQEYECYKQAAQNIDALSRVNREIFLAHADVPEKILTKTLPQINLQDLCFTFQEVLERAKMYENHQIQREVLSTRARMAQILVNLKTDSFVDFVDFFTPEEGAQGVIVTFSAILELLRQAIIEMIQTEPFGKIHVKKNR